MNLHQVCGRRSDVLARRRMKKNFVCEDKREDKCEAQASKFERGGRGSKFRAEASKGNREKAL